MPRLKKKIFRKISNKLKNRHFSNAIRDTLDTILNEVEFLNKQSTVDCQILLEEILNRVLEKVSDLSSTSSEELHEDENKENVDPCCSSSLLPIFESDSGESDEYDFTWGSIEEYNEIQNYQLNIEFEKLTNTMDGYRIVNINYLLTKAITLQSNHNIKCTGGSLLFLKETRTGLSSLITYKCNICNKEISFSTENPAETGKINKMAVWGVLSTGSTFSHLKEFLSVMSIPPLQRNQFFNIQRDLGNSWKQCLDEDIKKVAEEERKIAIQNNQLDSDGIPYTTVYLDGGWSKRSYGHSYNASSGVGVIIGQLTGKVLFLGVRNKYCSICTRAQNRNEKCKQHICYKNWDGSSTAMEADIMVEGFNNSVPLHKLKYKHFIADGDSSVYAKIKEKVNYGSKVSKKECTNHCLKNYSKHLYNIKKNTKGVSVAARKFLTGKVIEKLVSAAQSVIYANENGSISMLKEDLRNSINHVFDNHLNCKISYCNDVGNVANDQTGALKNSGAHHHVYGALNLLITKCHLLIDNETNNKAETFMNILARFNMGKRLNFTQRNSFAIRSYLTALRYNNSFSWHIAAWKMYFGCEPPHQLTKYIDFETKCAMNRNKSIRKRKIKEPKQSKDYDYGPNIAEVEISESDLALEVNNLVKRLQVTEEERNKIETETKGQFNNPRYIEEKLYRLTASNFGEVAKRRDDTSCDIIVKKLLNRSCISTTAIEYGLKNESVAISKFQEITGKIVSPSGLFVDLNNGIFGASPDGLIGDDGIIEVKCLEKVALSAMTLIEAVEKKMVPCLCNYEGRVQLKKNHNYYYQIQGQLAITKRNICYFIVYTGDNNDLFIEEIYLDKTFYENMFKKLERFYMHCLAPEVILNRRGRNLKCRDPNYILEAQKEKEIKKKLKLQ